MSKKRFDYTGRLGGLDDDRLMALAKMIELDNRRLVQEPLYRHKFNNDAQSKFREMVADYRVLIGGNKIGKTDELGFELVAMCKGKCDEFGINFPHKPPLKIWYCGRDRNVLSDEPLSSIKRYLKGDGIDYNVKYSGSTVLKMTITNDAGVQSEIWFKPYNGDIGIFESANVHAVFMDEEPPRDVFSAVKTKVAIMPGTVFIAMTPDRGLTWTYDLFEGSDPDHGSLVRNGDLQMYKCSVFDNVRNFKVEKGFEWVKYPPIARKVDLEYRVVNGELEVSVPDMFHRYLSKFEFMSEEYKMRILGEYMSFTGKVYPFDRYKNTFELGELPNFEDLKWFGALDYGYADECCYMLIGVDVLDNYWVLDGFYQSGLYSREQAKKIKQVNDYWGVKPLMIVADSQIANTLPEKDSLKPHIDSIKAYYIDELGVDYTAWRTEMIDKRDPVTKRDLVVQYMVNGKLRFCTFEDRLRPIISELGRLEYRQGSVEQFIQKADHADATLRMFFGAKVRYSHYEVSKERQVSHWQTPLKGSGRGHWRVSDLVY